MGNNNNTYRAGHLTQFTLFLTFVFGLFFTGSANAQLTFNLDVAVQDETCNGNGAITMNVTGATVGSLIEYFVYKLPGLESVPTVLNSAPGLDAGTYKVVVLQTLVNLTNPVTVEEVIVEDAIEPLNYTFLEESNNCSQGGSLIVVGTSGTPVSYEIINGPVTVPLQSSNVFAGIPNGTYLVRVFDSCGVGLVTTYTTDFDPVNPVITPPVFESTTSGDCDSILVTNSFSYPEGTVITYPLTIQYTIHPPGGAPDIVESQTFNSGAPSLLEFTNEFDTSNNELYTYDLLITDGCGNTYTLNGSIVDPAPSITVSKMPLPCGEYFLSVNVSQYTGPYTLEFLTPTGFNPVLYNAQHPNFPDGQDTVLYGGGGNPIPNGIYTVRITDACGRTAENAIEIITEELVPFTSGTSNGCFSNEGRFTVGIPGRAIVFAEVIDAPQDYIDEFGIPNDVSEFINNIGRVVLTNVPIGTYYLDVIDECGVLYENIEVIVEGFTITDFSYRAVADCNEGVGSVQISSGNGKLVTMSMVSSDVYDATFPFDVSFNIDAPSGVFFMDNLPEGNYVFEGTDACGETRTVTVAIVGYHPDPGLTYTFVPNCNSFDIIMDDSDTSTATPTYWLQMKDPETGQWEHPATGVPFTEGSMPNNSNSLSLPNNQTTYNLQYYGTFRIVKAFLSVGPGTSQKLCFQPISSEFEYQYGVTIENIYKISCSPTPGDVYVEATGLGPLLYRIKFKDGEPFVVENGTNNIFTGLAPGIYVFEVENACGQPESITVNVDQIPNLVSAQQPGNVTKCVGPNEATVQVFDLTEQNAAILGTQAPGSYNVTYHLTQEDADTGDDPIQFNYTNISNPQMLYARVIHNLIGICNATTSFMIEVAESPIVSPQDEVFICDDQESVILSVESGYDGYLWLPGGQTTSSVEVFEPGTYTVFVTKNYASGPCTTPLDIVVSPSISPGNITLETSDWTENQNSITVNVAGSGVYQYSLDNENFQDSPVFTGLEPGNYTVYIKDTGGCGTRQQDISLLNYPKFFTPNNDGVNETWRIENSWNEPNLIHRIYDRYGKLLTSFGVQTQGWDGTYNGAAMPSTDYWFVVERQNGQIFKGHFALIR